MIAQEIQWLVGLAVTLSLGWITILVGAFRSVMNVVRDNETVSKRRVDELHTRVNRVREDVVHKSDLNEISLRLSQDMREMRIEHQASSTATNERLDALMSAIVIRNNSHNNDKS